MTLDIFGGIGTGWRKLLEKLIQDLNTLQIAYEILQVKEKFATLRFYASVKSEDKDKIKQFHEIIARAEEASSKICENCGTMDGVTDDAWNGYWLKTLCQPCGELIKSGKLKNW